MPGNGIDLTQITDIWKYEEDSSVRFRYISVIHMVALKVKKVSLPNRIRAFRQPHPRVLWFLAHQP